MGSSDIPFCHPQAIMSGCNLTWMRSAEILIANVGWRVDRFERTGPGVVVDYDQTGHCVWRSPLTLAGPENTFMREKFRACVMANGE